MQSVDLKCKGCNEIKPQLIRHSSDLMPEYIKHLQCTGCSFEWISLVDNSENATPIK
jgi:hypothetical protein